MTVITSQVSQLKQHSAETPEELALLHPADRLMLRLIKIPHLADRIGGMLYQVNFEESIALLEKVSVLRLADEGTTTDLVEQRVWTCS